MLTHTPRFYIMQMFAVVLVAQLLKASALDNGLALTPPMGWCSWERFRCSTDCVKHPTECISEALIIAQAQQLIAGGYRDAGYIYINIDDCWQSHIRDGNGRLQPDAARFPHGMKWLADYLHGQGLKLGMYTDYGSMSCQGYPGTPWERQQIDASTFAEWGVDFIKVDGCNSDVTTMNDAYPRFGKFLNMTGRRMVYSCSWVDYLQGHVNHSFVAETCNLWRMQRDISAQWSVIRKIIHAMGSGQATFQPMARPGAWNDPDQLVIGDHRPGLGITVVEAQTMMAMWAIWAAPLLMSNDLRVIPAADTAILLNKAVIAVNQDKLGIQGTKFVDRNASSVTKCSTASVCSTRSVWKPQLGSSEIWARPLYGGDIAIVMYNKGEQPVDIRLHLTDLSGFDVNGLDVNAQDLFSGTRFVAHSRVLAKAVPPHGCRMFRLSAAEGASDLYSAQRHGLRQTAGRRFWKTGTVAISLLACASLLASVLAAIALGRVCKQGTTAVGDAEEVVGVE